MTRLQHFFEATAERAPQAVAVVTPQREWRYADLNAEASRLAHHLTGHHSIRPSQRVAIMLRPGVDACIAILGVLKAGAAYVPVDPSFPPERVAFICEDAEVQLLIGERRVDAGCSELTLMTDRAGWPDNPSTPLLMAAGGDDLAYIIYTSGTTGKPKGVGVTHANIVNFLNVVPTLYGVGSKDRVYQGMTPSFDFSLEEVWPTWIAGAALVPPPGDLRLVGDELHAFLKEQRVTILYAVPTLLATMHDELPDLHTINVGGEACPHELMVRWSRPGRRILNTYGPTETTITASMAVLTPERPVTIGKALPTYRIHVLDESLQPVSAGESGEICIGGPGVAWGYINRPELTAEKFVADPFSQGGRLYRTGDLGRETPNGEIEFLGRIDTQVKIRGYRIELSEIESVLVAQPHVTGALVHPFTGPDGVTVLVAYLLLQSSFTPGDEWRSAVHTELITHLPGYMVPAHLEVLVSFPTLASGKADRGRLPPPATPRLMSTGVEAVPPEGPTEHALARAWADAFKLKEVSATAHFFFDLGGDSLLVATVISALRKEPRFVGVSMSDIYKHPTIRELAAHLDTHAPAPPSAVPRDIRRAANWQVWLAGCVQFLAVYVLLIFFSETLTEALHVDDLGNWALIACAYVLMTVVVWLLLPIAIKWLVIGRFKPGRYPLWGVYFLRWWTVRTALRFVPLDYLAGTPVMRVYLRLLGAKIGSGCYIGSKNLLLPDLVTVGAGAHIGYNVDVLAHEIRDGWLIMQPVIIGESAYIGTNSLVFLGSTIGAKAMIGEQSLVPRHATIPPGEFWQGSPARPAEMPVALRELVDREDGKPVPLTLGPTLAYLAGAIGLYLMMFASQAPCIALLEEPVKHHDWWLALAWMIPGGTANVLFSCGMIALAKRLILPRMAEGVYPVHSVIAWRKWFCDKLVSTSLDVIYSVYATIYTKYWLRMLGVKAGRGSEISTLNFFDPNLLTLGEYSFVADQATLGAAVFHKGWFNVRRTEVAARAFVGNCAHLSLGCHMEKGSLLGVMSHKHDAPLEAASSWLGSPALHLQRREVVQAYDESVLFTPPLHIVWLRYVVEFFRIIIPQIVISLGFVVTVDAQENLAHQHSMLVALALAPSCFFVVGISMTLFAALMKWLLVRQYKPRMAPLWSPFVWASEMATSIYENIALPMLLNWFTGSPIFNVFLRLFGMKIGKRVYCDTTYVTEFDLIQIADDAQLAENITLQTHLFEDRVMKLSHVRVGEAAVIGQRAVMLYDTQMEPRSVLAPLSLVMKGESLPEATVWQGIPAELRDDLADCGIACPKADHAGESPVMRSSVLLALLLAAPVVRGADFNVESTMSYTLPVPSEGEVRSTFSALMDDKLTDHWHFVWGAEYERFDFDRGGPGLPETLQAVGGHFSLEYRVDDDPIFMLELQPGWHAGADFDHGTYDVPVTLASGVPITKDVDLAFGVYYSRLTRYPFLPVGGVVWKINDKLELDLVFPRSTLAWSMTKEDTLTAFADVLGTGFQVDGDAGQREKLEYYQTRTGVEWEHEFAPGWSSVVQAGWALDRTMDFYEQNRVVTLVPAPFFSLGFKARF